MDNSKSKESRRRGRRRNSKKEENRDENKPTFSLMSPALRRQLQTHKNILRLLHENNLLSTQINGQRILSIQPIRWSGPTPGIDCEIFVGRIPKTIFEDTLYPLFKIVGEIFQIRLMVDMAELTRGYCFIMYTNPENAAKAIAQLDQYEILPGKKIRVLASVNNCKLYVGPLPWHITSEEVVRVIYASAWDIEFVSIYRFLNHNAAYAIVSFKSHRNAALARRKLRPERLFKCNEVHVEWAHVDWDPSNVYEDRGTVDCKGDVQITRKHLQYNKKSTHLSTSKSISPICPPDDMEINRSKNTHGSNNTRYSNMLTMSAALNDSLLESCNKTADVTEDVNTHANEAQLDGHCDVAKNKISLKDSNKDNFRNFDMWNSSLVSQLPRSPVRSTSPKKHGLSTKMLDIPRCSWENNIEHTSLNIYNPKTYQCTNNTNVLNYHDKYHYHLANERADPGYPIVTDVVPHQVPLYQNCSVPETSYFMPQSPASPAAQHPQDASYEQYLIFNYFRNIPQMSTSVPSYQHNYSQTDGESLAIDRVFISGRKKNDRKMRPAKTPIKTENNAAVSFSYTGNAQSAKIQNMPKFAQRHARRVLLENTSSNVLSNDANDGRHPRPILKQTPDRVLP
ncbi:probable RNA-binding protein 46 isoform X2 [Harpegnathos saltator]|uniref:probable RNA-binding protein 46 isoform X2 n=1 Tax=Harpegnathos saltator TaxID=610380 RepID=UPI00094901B5|nr:probable RNA-binding protein 46 isoform X2 [Harpegnathos saltator]